MPDSITHSPMAPISPKEASAYTGYSERTLASWRRGRKEWAPDSKGPRYATMNGRIWYRRDCLERSYGKSSFLRYDSSKAQAGT